MCNASAKLVEDISVGIETNWFEKRDIKQIYDSV
jgi:hypothetical protein